MGFLLLGADPLRFCDPSLLLRLQSKPFGTVVVDLQKYSQSRGCYQGQYGNKNGPADGPLPFPPLQLVISDRKHGRQQAQLLVLQLFLPSVSSQIRRKRFHLRPVPFVIELESQQIRKACRRLPLHQNGQDPIPSLFLNEILQLSLTPPALQIPGRTDGNKPFAFVQCLLDIFPQI